MDLERRGLGPSVSRLKSYFEPQNLFHVSAVWRKQVTFNDVPNTWVNMEEKTGMWLGGVVDSTGTDGKALV